jgi:hypothetical protein
MMVKCHECGKSYDYHVDDFCPRCGAFTQPPKDLQVGADGSVVRVDGLNEQHHRGSFVHRELHTEERQRRGTVLEGEQTARVRQVRPSAGRDPQKRRRRSPLSVIFWIILAVIAFQMIVPLLFSIISFGLW